MSDKNLPSVQTSEYEEIRDTVEVGQWYWVKDQRFLGYANILALEERGEEVPDDDDFDNGERVYEEYEWFGCVINIGSNYVEIQSPWNSNSCEHDRVHFDNFHEECRLETDPRKVIQDNSDRVHGELGEKMEEVRKLTLQLGLGDVRSLPEPDAGDTLLPVVSRGEDIENYKHALARAKDKQLPKLFKEIEELNHELAYWLSAETVPMKAIANQMEGAIELVQDRVFHVELYSGLIEKVKVVRDGKTADMSEKVHIMQRRCYMDEECLIDYQHGGINFEKIEHFDRWLSKKKNFTRILPFPRCVVSFRVRRKKKDYRDIELNPFICVSMEEMDEKTFLYLRNGEKLYRLNTKLDFSEKLFPDTSEFHPGEKVWGKMFADRVDNIIPDRLYQQMVKEENERRRLSEEWEKKNPKKHWFDNPHRHTSIDRPSEYKPCDPSNVYFDDIKETIAANAKRYNRIALIIQGLFDRSEVFHPHAPVQMWDHKSFEDAVKLIYDAKMVLTDGDAPDFEEYRKKLNESIEAGTVVVGQEDFWKRREAQKENKRQENDWRIRHASNYVRFSPEGDPGPGLLAKVLRVRGKKCRFEWERRRARDYWKEQPLISCGISVPFDKVLNVDAYTPGDYHRFYDDPRTRAQYLRWAPLLLAAEDYHAGKLKVGEQFESEDY